MLPFRARRLLWFFCLHVILLFAWAEVQCSRDAKKKKNDVNKKKSNDKPKQKETKDGTETRRARRKSAVKAPVKPRDILSAKQSRSMPTSPMQCSQTKSLSFSLRAAVTPRSPSATIGSTTTSMTVSATPVIEVDRLGCKDYTPEIFKELQTYFDLLGEQIVNASCR